ncbi:hypothetical protein JCM33774_39150 [Actinophytocola sp. KF-1]
MSSIAACVVVLDADLRVRSWNRGAEELWGLRAAEADSADFFTLDFGLPAGGLRELVRRCHTEGRRMGPVELAAVDRRGRSFPCAVTCTPLNSDGGGVVRLMESLDQG